MGKRGPKPRPRITPEYIICQRCRVEKHHTEFHRASRTITLRQPYCIACRRLTEARPDSRQKKNARNKRYYASNKAKCNAMVTAWAKRNPDRVRENSRPGKRAYKARKRAAFTLSFTQKQLQARIDYYGGKCWICGQPWEHLDHVKPLARGGAHILANLRPACHSCNQIKKAAWPLQAVMARFVDKIG